MQYRIYPVVAVLVGLALWAQPASANASTGHFDAAEASPDWSTGNFTGTALWTCGTTCDAWLAIVMDQPLSSPCTADEWNQPGDPNRDMIYVTGAQTPNTKIRFAASNVPMLAGVVDQHLCLIGVQTASVEGAGTVVESELLAEAPVRPEPVVPPPAPTPSPLTPACAVAQHEVNRLEAKMRIVRHLHHSRAVGIVHRALQRAKRQLAARCP